MFTSLLAAGMGYAEVAGEWKALAHMPTSRQELATAVLNGKMYVIAGLAGNFFGTNNVDVYNPATNTWTSVAPIPILNHHNCAAVAAGKLYAFGGQSEFNFLYDPVNDSWSQVASMPSVQPLTAAVGVIDDKIYVAGVGILQVYDPATDTWATRAPMGVYRHHTAGGVIDGKFYVVGGRAGPGSQTALEVYDPQTNNWTRLANMPTGREGHAAGVVNGELFVFGGEGGGIHPEVEVYNPGSNSWRRVEPDMPHPRHGIWTSVIGNKIYIAGGGLEENISETSWTHVFIVNSPATFANISTRLKVETGDNALIGGFIVTGAGSKRIVVRAIGPSVPLTGTLGNPTLELYNGAGQVIAANDNWQEAPNKQEIIDSSLAPTNPMESAILTTVTPGNHTAIVRGAGGETGIGLVEVYDLEAGSTSRLANISTRGFVETDPNVLIGGLIVDGQIPRKTVVRAIGPSLALPDKLADPFLELHDSNGVVLSSNDNWGNSPDVGEITAANLAPTHQSESAIFRTLSPGNYTAIVRGKNAGTGVAVVEAYALD